MATTEATNHAVFSARATFDRLVRVETLLWNRCDDELRAQTGLPLGRLEVLRVIAGVENCRVGDITAHLHITVGAVSKLVDRLEGSGHCQRQPNPDDRRSSVLFVTELGRKSLAQAEKIIEPLLRKYLDATSLDHLSAALTRIEQALAEGLQIPDR